MTGTKTILQKVFHHALLLKLSKQPNGSNEQWRTEEPDFLQNPPRCQRTVSQPTVTHPVQHKGYIYYAAQVLARLEPEGND